MRTLVKLQKDSYLNLRAAVSRKIISTRTARALLNPGNAKDIVKFQNESFIQVKSLSTELQNRLAALAKQSEIGFDKDDDHVAEIEFVLSFAFNSDSIWRKNLPRFTEMYLTEEQKIKLSKTYAYASAMLGMSNEGYSLKQIFKAHEGLVATFDLSNLKCGSYDYFTSKLKELRLHGIERGIVNAKTNVVRLAKKVTKVHQKYLNKFYADPARYKYKKIKQLVNHEVIKLGLHPISLSSVKMYLRQPEIQNTYKAFRFGKKWAEDNLYPYLIRAKPKKTNHQWQSDCTCLNFYVQDVGDESPSRRWLCAVVDTKSRRILSHQIGKYETAQLIEATFLQAVMTTRVIPNEILHDNSSSFCSLRIKEIESRMEGIGSYVRKSTVNNAKDHGLIESIWGQLQSEFRSERGYLGNGPRSFTEEGRVDPTLRKEYYDGKKGGLWSEVDLKEMVGRVISRFNNNEL